MTRKKLVVVALLAVLAALLVYLGPEKYLNLEYVKSQLDALIAYRRANPVLSSLVFMGIYVTVTAVSLPGALIMTLAGGAVFGFWLGSLLVLISATIGATIAFLIARYLFDDLVKAKMGERLAKIRAKFHEEGAFYLFSIRLVPVFPFFVVNLVMGLTSIGTGAFAVATFLGMIGPSMAFVNAGTQLARLESVRGLLSPQIIVSFLILAAMPYAARYLVGFLKARRA